MSRSLVSRSRRPSEMTSLTARSGCSRIRRRMSAPRIATAWTSSSVSIGRRAALVVEHRQLAEDVAGAEVRQRDRAAVGVLADGAGVPGADDVARVALVALAEDRCGWAGTAAGPRPPRRARGRPARASRRPGRWPAVLPPPRCSTPSVTSITQRRRRSRRALAAAAAHAVPGRGEQQGQQRRGNGAGQGDDRDAGGHRQQVARVVQRAARRPRRAARPSRRPRRPRRSRSRRRARSSARAARAVEVAAGRGDPRAGELAAAPAGSRSACAVVAAASARSRAWRSARASCRRERARREAGGDVPGLLRLRDGRGRAARAPPAWRPGGAAGMRRSNVACPPSPWAETSERWT